jgi:hypothetical protein
MVDCRYDSSRRCFRNLSCSVFDPATGLVSVCVFFRGGNFSASRKVVPVLRSGWSKHRVR